MGTFLYFWGENGFSSKVQKRSPNFCLARNSTYLQQLACLDTELKLYFRPKSKLKEAMGSIENESELLKKEVTKMEKLSAVQHLPAKKSKEKLTAQNVAYWLI